MHIRLRDRDGRLLPERPHFVELVNEDGAVARVLYRRPDGAIVDFTSADAEEAARYAQAMRVKFVTVQNMDAADVFVTPEAAV